MENGKRIRGEDVICKLKDDGDFDKLRLKIIRKLKDNEELRKSIIATVQESVALNRPGAENMKPRQLSDAIFQEVGDKVMGKISEELWNTIRTGDGIQTEITQTVQSVYNKLLNPQLNESGESASHSYLQPAQNGVEGSNQNSKSDHKESSKEESGLPVPTDGKPRETHTKSETSCSLDVVADNMDAGAPSGFAIGTKEKNPDVVNDEDPEVPPGFG